MNNLLDTLKMFAKKNGPTILTCIGSVGVVITSVMAIKATPKAIVLLENARDEKGDDLTKFERLWLLVLRIFQRLLLEHLPLLVCLVRTF